MAITAAMVKELREMTGAGMMDCKKALTKTEGDMDAAVEFLRENGLAKAAKKAGRIAAEGLVAVALSDDAKEAAIVEVNSETDFVAKNDTFKAYVAEVADQALTTAAADIEGFLAEDSKAEAGKTVKEALDGKIAVIGENLNIRRFAKVSAADGFVASYIHAGGKIGVLVEVATDVVNDEIKEMAKNVAMQVAALGHLDLEQRAAALMARAGAAAEGARGACRNGVLRLGLGKRLGQQPLVVVGVGPHARGERTVVGAGALHPHGALVVGVHVGLQLAQALRAQADRVVQMPMTGNARRAPLLGDVRHLNGIVHADNPFLK